MYEMTMNNKFNMIDLNKPDSSTDLVIFMILPIC